MEVTKKKTLRQRLLKMRVELELWRKEADTFEEETILNSVIYSVGTALDILNNKKTLLQGPNDEDSNG